MKPVRLAVAGLGWIGRKHAQLIVDHDGCLLVGLCDADDHHAAVAREFGVPFHANIEQLLEDEAVEGVVIATPNRVHGMMAEACARHSVHALIEKPIAETLDEARRVVHVCDQGGIRVLVGHHRRHSPFIREARSIVDSGTLGQLVGVSMLWALAKPDDYFDQDWRCQRPGGGPTLINLIHELDSLRFLCGEIRQVYAVASSAVRKLEVEDSLSITLSFENGTLGSILASDATPSPWSYEATTGENPHYFRADENSYHFLGTAGSLSFPRMEVWRYPDELAGWQHPLENLRHHVEEADPLQNQLEHFCRVVRHQEEPLVDARDGLRSLAAAVAVLDSAERGVPVEVPQS